MLHSQIIRFLFDYDAYLMSAGFAAVCLFGIINRIHNVYRRQNRKLESCRASIFRSPKFTGVFVANLPEEYRRQWRAFVNSEAAHPSLVFEFVPRKNKLRGILPLLLGSIVSIAYLTLFVLDISQREYLLFAVAFWLAFAVIMLLNTFSFGKKERAARQVFGRFVAQLNAVDFRGTAKNGTTLTQELQKIAKRSCSVEDFRRVGELLRQDGLNNNRTADEQRSINRALNSLLQAYARNSEKA